MIFSNRDSPDRRLLIRADSSFAVGTGHIVRCLSIASELRNRGVATDFWSRALPGNVNRLLREAGFNVFEGEALSVSDIGSTERYRVLLVDHYELDQSDESKLREIASKIVVIDDWGVRKHDADLIIDPSDTEGSRTRQAMNPDTPFLTGYQWIMMRPEFSVRRALAIPRVKVKNVLFFFGGTDSADLTELYACECEDRKQWAVQNRIQFNFLISTSHPKFEHLRRLERKFFSRFHLSPKSVADLMLKMDFYAGSAGSVTWERMALGLTGAVMTVASNQEEIASRLHESGFHKNLGSCPGVKPSDVFGYLEECIQNPKDLAERSGKCLDLVDGLGSRRLADEIIAKFFSE